jgi:hypothetical protein
LTKPDTKETGDVYDAYTLDPGTEPQQDDTDGEGVFE